MRRFAKQFLTPICLYCLLRSSYYCYSIDHWSLPTFLQLFAIQIGATFVGCHGNGSRHELNCRPSPLSPITSRGSRRLYKMAAKTRPSLVEAMFGRQNWRWKRLQKHARIVALQAGSKPAGAPHFFLHLLAKHHVFGGRAAGEKCSFSSRTCRFVGDYRWQKQVVWLNRFAVKRL